MLVRDTESVPSQTMTMPGAVGVTMKLLVGRADGAPTFAMRQFTVEPTGHTPLHQHNYEHEVLIVEGAGVLHTSADGSGDKAIKAGDALLIPANQLHQFHNVSGAPLKFVCLVPVKFDCGGGECKPTPGS